jgi:hypothetical protein
MKKNYSQLAIKSGLHFLRKTSLALVLTAIGGIAQAQTSYTFTSAGLVGPTGPTQAQINAAYAATNLNGSVTVPTATPGVQTFTIPATGPYRITAIGGHGGYIGGFGASIAGDFTLTAGTVLKILVGQAGTQLGNGSFVAGGGGGGSFVTSLTNAPYVVAGGGGGGGDGYAGGAANSTITGISGALTTAGYAYPFPASGANGGTGGNGGTCAPSLAAGSGAGIFGNGSVCSSQSAPLSFTNGGAGGLGTSGGSGDGGFGGGAGGYSSGVGNRGGGAGGYSGGGGGTAVSSEPQAPGGGGGSFNSGVNQINAISTETASGKVVIELLCFVSLTSSGQNSLAPSICSGNSVTLTTNAASNYTWSTNNTSTTSIVVSPTVTTTYSVVGTSTANCSTSAFITVTVSGGLPTLAISNPSNTICLGRSVSLLASGALTYTWTNPGVVNGQTFTPATTAVYTVQGQNGCGITTGTTVVTVTPLQVTTLASPTLVCQGYTTALTAVSSVGGYTWFPTGSVGSNVVVSPTANIIYTVVATDGTCAGTQTVAVNTLVTPTITAAISNTRICLGEIVTLTANGAGTGGSYLWSPSGSTAASFTVAPSTTTLYAVAGTNSLNCSATSNQFVIVDLGPPTSIAAVNNKTLVCVGGTTALQASGAVTYSWTGGPQSSAYTVTQTAASSVYTVLSTGSTNTCVTSNTISVAALISNAIVTASTSVCQGNTATLTASGANTYAWNGAPASANGNFIASPTSNTTYVVVANTISGSLSCPKTLSSTVVVNALPTVSVVATRTAICKGESTKLTGSGTPNMTWTPGGATTTTITINPSTTSFYTLTGVDANGCTNSFVYQAKVSTCQGLVEATANTNLISVYPSPANTELHINSAKAVELKLINSIGQTVRIISVQADVEQTVQVKDLSTGVYFLIGENETGKINQKVVIAN